MLGRVVVFTRKCGANRLDVRFTTETVTASSSLPACDVRMPRTDSCKGGPLKATTEATTTPTQEIASTRTDGRFSRLGETARALDTSRTTLSTDSAATRTTGKRSTR